MFVTIDHLTKEIKGTKVLDDISIDFERGKIYGLQGKNGSGKTMLMRAISGLIKATSGSVTVGGKVLGKDVSFPESIGVLIENPVFISKYRGFKNLKILASIRNKITDQEVKDILEKVGLDPDDKRSYRKYSLGMKQRLGIACALMENPDIILLDEPINALDESGVLLVRDLIITAKEKGALIIVACHDKDELELLADEIYSMSDGKIVGHSLVNKEVVV